MAFLQSASFKPAFIIGVTGHIDLDPGQFEKVKAALESVFSWLQTKKRIKGIGHPGLGLENTPIILLSSLAPGADQWAVEVARGMVERGILNIHVLAPLPFFKDQYLQSSSFQRDGVEEHQKNLLISFHDENTFVVRETDELDCDEQTLRQRYETILTGDEGKAKRDRRYLAAGEYVAAYSDILLVLSEKPVGRLESAALIEQQSPGAVAVAQRKLRRMFNLIPTAPALAGSDSGPVIHICAPRSPKPNDPSSKNETSKAGHIEVFFPYDSRPPGLPKEEFQNKGWQKEGYKKLAKIAANFQQLNNEQVKIDPGKEEAHFSEMLPDGDSALASNEALLDRLHELARLRRRIADYNRYYDRRVKNLRRALFGLAFFSASFFIFAENWEPMSKYWIPISDHARGIFFWAAVVGTLAAWLLFVRFRSTAGNSDDRRADDYRAIAEGLRVQFYWMACGCGKSVASNYLQRQHNEIGWIRSVISAAAFPYEPMRYNFKSLATQNLRTLLTGIQAGWIERQSEYFSDTIRDLKKHRSFFEHYSAAMLSSAFALSIYNFSCQKAPRHFFRRNEGLGLCGAALVILGLLAGISLLISLLRLRKKNQEMQEHQKKQTQGAGRSSSASGSGSSASMVDRILSRLFLTLNLFLPGPPEARGPGKYLLRGALFVATTMFVLGLAYYCCGIHPLVPEPIKTSAILRSLLLAGGALCGLWVSENHMTENIKRYESMEAMFKSADERFKEYLSAWDDKTVNVDEEVLRDIRSLIKAVGCEALSENSEWLFTHRARPIEPVSA